MKARGFTLVEVLVALAIVAVALMASVRAVGEMAESSAELKLRLLAGMSAQNQVALLRATGTFLPTGESSVACPQGKIALVCRQKILATPNPLFQRIEVRVYIDGEDAHHLAELVGILANET
jgi:general secretion pathway protein I